jgi:hypothetical protein
VGNRLGAKRPPNSRAGGGEGKSTGGKSPGLAILKKYKQAKDKLVAAKSKDDSNAEEEAQNELNALILSSMT